MYIIIILFILASCVFLLYLSPSICANIAQKKGFDYNKWFVHGIVYNVFTVFYLFLICSDKEHDRDSKGKLFLLLVGYFLLFFGAYLIDKYTDF